jgi:hypothetical protein
MQVTRVGLFIIHNNRQRLFSQIPQNKAKSLRTADPINLVLPYQQKERTTETRMDLRAREQMNPLEITLSSGGRRPGGVRAQRRGVGRIGREEAGADL